VYIFYNNIHYIKNEPSAYAVIKFFLHKIFFGSEYHLWFIYTILGCYLFVPIIRKWIKYSSKNEVLYFLFLWAVTIIIAIPGFNKYFPQIPIFQFSGYMGFFMLGYYINTVKVNARVIPLVIFLFGTGITAVGTYYLSRKHGNFAGTLYGYLTPNVVISSVGAYLFLINIKIENSYMIKMLNLIGKYSFGIYFVHVLVLRLLGKYGVDWKTFNPLVSIPMTSILCLILSLLVIVVFNKSRYLKVISG
jgi:surface polysaccharide O-acyltransferase-like enzyme